MPIGFNFRFCQILPAVLFLKRVYKNNSETFQKITSSYKKGKTLSNAIIVKCLGQ